ncbi:Ig-like domain-containing protein [Escherichia coli]|nr:Ig-like domain-containing protein [Escherichia coli]
MTVLLNGKGYSATIQNNGSWSVNVPAADVAALADGTSYTVSASAQDSAGNSATASRSVAVDLTRAGYQHKHGFNGRPTQRRRTAAAVNP